jgi:hypothetical protein
VFRNPGGLSWWLTWSGNALLQPLPTLLEPTRMQNSFVVKATSGMVVNFEYKTMHSGYTFKSKQAFEDWFKCKQAVEDRTFAGS